MSYKCVQNRYLHGTRSFITLRRFLREIFAKPRGVHPTSDRLPYKRKFKRAARTGLFRRIAEVRVEWPRV